MWNQLLIKTCLVREREIVGMRLFITAVNRRYRGCRRSGAGFKPDWALFCKNVVALTYKCPVQKLTTYSALQLYVILLLLPDLRYGFLNLEALYNFASSLTRTQLYC